MKKVAIKVALNIIILLLALEGGSWIVLKVYPLIKAKTFSLDLDVYEMPVPDNCLWVPRPGRYTLKTLYEDKLKKGRTVGAKFYKQLFGKGNLDKVVITVNKFHFRGQNPSAKKKPKGKIRIMAIGDSCTFGLYGDYNYPKQIEVYLHTKGYKNVEVINAGVEGYSTIQVVERLDYYLSFNPDIVILYIGWNDLYCAIDSGSATAENVLEHLHFIKLCKKVYRKILNRYYRDKMKKEKGYWYPNVLDGKYYKRENIKYKIVWKDRINYIIDKLKEHNITTILVTLPHIFLYDSPPSDEILKTAHLPHPNAYRLIALIKSYNDYLRQLAKQNNFFLIDLDRYVTEKFGIEKYKHFLDTLHPNQALQVDIGWYIGEFIVKHNLLHSSARNKLRSSGQNG